MSEKEYPMFLSSPGQTMENAVLWLKPVLAAVIMIVREHRIMKRRLMMPEGWAACFAQPVVEQKTAVTLPLGIFPPPGGHEVPTTGRLPFLP